MEEQAIECNNTLYKAIGSASGFFARFARRSQGVGKAAVVELRNCLRRPEEHKMRLDSLQLRIVPLASTPLKLELAEIHTSLVSCNGSCTPWRPPSPLSWAALLVQRPKRTSFVLGASHALSR
jgi:hypothetical protein